MHTIERAIPSTGRNNRTPCFSAEGPSESRSIGNPCSADVSREPLVLSVPKVDDKRYYTFQIWDPNGDTFAYVGTRTAGREAGHYAFVGPDWKGTLPANVKRIDSVYILCHLGTRRG